MEGYLNSVSYGGRLRGVEAAAWSYFGVPSRDLSLGQAALLAGLPKSPRRYDPRKHADQAFGRQRRVLGRMKEWGWLDADALTLALAEKISIQAEDRRLRAPRDEYGLVRQPGDHNLVVFRRQKGDRRLCAPRDDRRLVFRRRKAHRWQQLLRHNNRLVWPSRNNYAGNIGYG